MPSALVHRLRRFCSGHGLEDLADQIGSLVEIVQSDLESVDAELEATLRSPSLVDRTAAYLLGFGGKRLRPLCVALSSRLGQTFTPAALDLAVAVELVHNATLLHDDVVDCADQRRGRASARAEFGNAASIFAGDALLIEALIRVERANIDGLLKELLETIACMIEAESLQLEHRGSLEVDRDLYFRVAEGKSALLFCWGMKAGGRAAKLDPEICHGLEKYGHHLGLAFQVVDDLLDLTGQAMVTGKALFTDLREGKLTYPLIVALERDPGLRLILEEVIAPEAPEATQALAQRVVESLEANEVASSCRSLARQKIELAVEALAPVPDGEAKRALEMVAQSTIERKA